MTEERKTDPVAAALPRPTTDRVYGAARQLVTEFERLVGELTRRQDALEERQDKLEREREARHGATPAER